jgi:hypothetical protein
MVECFGEWGGGKESCTKSSPNLHETKKKNREFWGGFVQDSVQDFFPLKMVQILHKNLAPKIL